MNTKIKLVFVTQKDCHQCTEAEEFLSELKHSYPNLEIKIIDSFSPEGKKLVIKHFLIDLPGIFINGKLFSTGTLDRQRFLKAVNSPHEY